MKAAAQPRKSVLLFIDSLKIGGAERVTLQWAEWLSQAGWSVTLLTSKADTHDFYPVPAGLRRLREPALPALLDRVLFWPLKLLRLRKLLRRMPGWFHHRDRPGRIRASSLLLVPGTAPTAGDTTTRAPRLPSVHP